MPIQRELYNPDNSEVQIKTDTPRKNEGKTKGTKKRGSIGSFFTNPATRYGAGFVMLFFCVYLLISFISFFSSGEFDQSEVDNVAINMQNPESIKNAGAILGAYLSSYFIEKGVGLSAFIVILWSFIIGFRLILKRKVFFFHITIISLWSLLVCCTIGGAVSYYIDAPFMNLGGHLGAYLNRIFVDYLGKYGMVLLNVLFLLIWILVFYTSITAILRYVREHLGKAGFGKLRPSGSAANNPLSDFKGDSNETETTEKDAEDEKEPVEFSQETEKDGSDSVETEIPAEDLPYAPKEEKKVDDSGIEVAIIESAPIEQGKGKITEAFDPKKELSRYKFPGIDMLRTFDNGQTSMDLEEQDANMTRIKNTLSHYGIEIKKIDVHVGPTITLFEIVPENGIRIAKIRTLEDDIALSLAALGIRIIAPMPGRGTIGIEVPNKDPQTVSMRSIINSKAFMESKAMLPLGMGCTVTNEVFVADLTKMPHLLVAGATGQGKSVGLNAMITSLLYKKHPAELKFVLIDPKCVEFSLYSKLENHYLAQLPDVEKPIITDTSKVVATLNSCVELMEQRYKLLELAGERNVKDYNSRFINRQLNPADGHDYMPYVVIIIDEFADLIMTAGKEVETPIVRIAQKARAVGIHMIIATQRPSTNVITGIIKANFPGRVAFKVTQMVDSRTIIDRPGAQQLVGKGDMLFSADGEITRLQCAFIDTPEVQEICSFIHNQVGYANPYYLPEPPVGVENGMGGNGGDAASSNERDPLLPEVISFIMSGDIASTSSVQRRFSIGYVRAGRIMDQLENIGIVGPAQGSKPRKVLMSPSEMQTFVDNLG